MKHNQRFAGVMEDLRQIFMAYDSLLFISIYIEELEEVIGLMENEKELINVAFSNKGDFIRRLVRLTVKEGDPLGGKGAISVRGLKFIIECVKPRLYKNPQKMLENFNRSLLFHIIREINDNPKGSMIVEINKDYVSSVVKRAALKTGYTLPEIKGYYRSEYNCVSKTLKTKNFTTIVLPDYIVKRLKKEMPLEMASAA